MRGQRGQEVVELALVLPLLLIVLLGIVEFGRAWLTMGALSAASREGCRVAVLNAPDSVVTYQALESLVKAGIDTTGARVERTGPEAQDSEWKVRVQVTVPFKAICGTILPQLGGGLKAEFPMRAAAVMRFQGQYPDFK